MPWTRNERSATAGLKTTSYAENVVALAHAKERGGIEAVFANTRGELCEGTGTNVFVVVDGELLTPPLESGCLAGITRELTLEWCRAEGLAVREQALPLSVLADGRRGVHHHLDQGRAADLRGRRPVAAGTGAGHRPRRRGLRPQGQGTHRPVRLRTRGRLEP